MSKAKTKSASKTRRSNRTDSSSMTLRASVLDTLTRAGLITLGVAVTFLCLWVAACMVRAVANNGAGGLISGFVSALAG